MEGDKLLGKCTASGKQKASFTDKRSTGFDYGRATHNVYYRDKKWTQNTFM